MEEKDHEEHVTRVLFCGRHFPNSHVYTRQYLQNYPSIQVDDFPSEDIPKVIGKYDICVVQMTKLDSEIINAAERMKLIMQFGVGLEGVDVDAATKCGIKVARIPGSASGNAASCAEMAIYLMLGLLRKQNEMAISIKQRMLGDPVGEQLQGKTVFILGLGNIGTDLAKRLRPFGVKIIATKRSWTSNLKYSSKIQSNGQNGIYNNLVDEKGNHEDIYKFASKADIIVCCLTLNKETVGVVNRSFISSMKKVRMRCFMLNLYQGARLVNIARGGLLDYEAVYENLEIGHLGGLGMDVAWNEPFNPDDPILHFNNVIITPHVAGVTETSYRFMAKIVGDVAIQLHEGSNLTGIEFVN